MDFSVKERVLLLKLLPAQGDITTLRLVRTLREELSFSEEEHRSLRFQNQGQLLRWEPDMVAPKEIPLGLKMSSLICRLLSETSEAGKLTEEYLDLYKRFIPED